MFRTSPSIPRFRAIIHIDDRRIKGGRSRSLVAGPRWRRAPNCFCKPKDESGRAKLLCFRSRNACSDMGNKTVSLLPLWEATPR
jgi:transposase